MSKKQDFIRSEQNRDKHSDRLMKGSAAEQAQRAQAKGNPADHQLPGTPKLANDHNKVGHQEPTQTNQGQRTPESRHERQITAGTMNVVQARTGGKGGGRSTRGGNVGGAG
ncbi:hypothetical protein [Ramlibacter tataouinensis]|uniref:Uncharacterized protein n=1 Tax=Ramlibacter tataouinensis (strain ATCC BAA-407 / DSM 14655 / LMG 21543 / TTB310) TaxID=365046 RepID=F5Y2B7_RAMTT|nr:hypothetical protein [Ramlibacter tataouinensis]AEG91091.1 Hypothetical protein Rta_00310 [Ramlibacter tataouinensis TTB310]